MLPVLPELRFTMGTTDYPYAPLTHSPNGWDESLIKYERSMKYYGVFRSFSVPLKFVKDGALYLRQEFYKYGQASAATLLIEKLNRSNLTYETLYSGTFDFSTFKDTDYSVDITIIDGGIAQYFKNNETTEYIVPNQKPFTTNEVDVIIEYGGNPYMAISLKSMFRWLVNLMTEGKVEDGTYTVESSFLDNLATRIAMTPGNAWGQTFNQDANYFKMTMADFFKSVNAIWPVGIGVEVWGTSQKIVLESRDYFFDYSDSTAILYDEVKDLSVTLVKEWQFNKVKMGFAERNYREEESRLYEPNTYSVFTIPCKTSGQELDMVSKVRGDFQGIIEIMMDSSYDNSEADPYIVELGSSIIPGTYSLANGLIAKKSAPTTYQVCVNAGLTPMNSLINHSQWLSDFLFGFAGGEFTFSSGGNDQSQNETKNIEYTTTQLKEYDTMTVLAPSLIYPILVDFVAPYPVNFYRLLQDKPYGLINFYYRGNLMKGYFIKADVKMPQRAQTKFTLLLSTLNDLSPLYNDRV